MHCTSQTSIYILDVLYQIFDPFWYNTTIFRTYHVHNKMHPHALYIDSGEIASSSDPKSYPSKRVPKPPAKILPLPAQPLLAILWALVLYIKNKYRYGFETRPDKRSVILFERFKTRHAFWQRFLKAFCFILCHWSVWSGLVFGLVAIAALQFSKLKLQIAARDSTTRDCTMNSLNTNVLSVLCE